MIIDTDPVRPCPPAPLDPLDRRIVGALQVDGRAPWSRIAEILGETPRTVGRRGNALLDDGTVRVTALPGLTDTFITVLRCAPTRADAVARAVAARDDVVFTYTLTGPDAVVAELLAPPGADVAVLTDSLAAIDGVHDRDLAPVLHYFRTTAEWRPALLTPDEIAGLALDVPIEQNRPDARLDETDRALLDALVADGRIPFDALGVIGGCSEATARRRVETLVENGVVRIRAVVEPATIGLPLETMLWLDCPPGVVMRVGEQLAESPHVRYAALLLDGAAVLAHVAVPDVAALRDLLTGSPWTESVQRVRTTTVARPYKRSGALTGRWS